MSVIKLLNRYSVYQPSSQNVVFLLQGLPIRPVSHYGCPPLPDMQDLITDCLQYLTNNRPKVSRGVLTIVIISLNCLQAQEVFDRLCRPEFMALRQVIPAHEKWEIICFTIRVRGLETKEDINVL